MSAYIFKNVVLTVLVFALTSCGDLPRDNMLDPKNNDSYTQTVVLLEAFVNYAAPGQYSFWAVNSLEEVQQTYPKRVLIAEYHRDVNGYDDPYSSEQASTKFTQIQDAYIGNGQPGRGVPDVFVNGASRRVSGASSSSSVQEEVTPLVDDLLAAKNYFVLQPRVSLSMGNDTTCTVTCRVARLGNKTNENLRMRIIIIKDENAHLNHHRVLDVSLQQPVGTLHAGEFSDVKFDPVALSEIPTSVVAALFSADGKTVLQAVEEVVK